MADTVGEGEVFEDLEATTVMVKLTVPDTLPEEVPHPLAL